MKHYAYKCEHCGKISENEQCFCTLLNDETIAKLKSFFEDNGVEVEEINKGTKESFFCSDDGIERLWIFTNKGRFDLPGHSGMGILNDKIFRKFCTFSDKLFKSQKIEISKKYIVEINGKKKSFYGINKKEVRDEAEQFVLKNTKIEFVD